MTPRRGMMFACGMVVAFGLCRSSVLGAESGEGLEPGPTGLMIDLLTMPDRVEIANSRPPFGWIMGSNRPQELQTAYRILVSSGPDTANKDVGDVWDSGRVESGQSVAVPFGGKGLSANAAYCWKVRTWNSTGRMSEWSKVQTFRTGALSDRHVTTRLPLVKHTVAPVRVVQVSEQKTFVDFGRAAYGTIELTLDSPEAGRSVEIHLGEVAADETSVHRRPGGSRRYRMMTLPVNQGKHTYVVEIPRDRRNSTGAAIVMPKEIGEVLPFRYCEIYGAPSAIQPSTIRQVVVTYPFNDEASDFESSDRVLNEVWKLCKYSMKATSFCGVFVDGDRERIPYEADAYVNQLGYTCVDREYAISRYTHEYLITHPTWPTEWIILSVFLAWTDYEYTGDDRSLRAFYQDLGNKTLIGLARDDGLISTTTGLLTDRVLESVHFRGTMKDIVDWPHGDQGGVRGQYGETDGFEFLPINTVVNAYHIRSVILMARIAKVLGKDDDAQKHADHSQRALKAFNEKLFDKGKGIYVDGEGSRHSSLHANMFPLAFGLVPEGRVRTVADFVAGRGMVCSVYGAQFLLEALYRTGRSEAALKLMNAEHDRGWYNMIREGSTISMEAWDDKYKPNQDWNHAWGAAPANIIPRLLMGVEPLEPGCSRIRIRPQPASLAWARVKVPTIRGSVQVHVRRQEGAVRMTLDIPANVVAEVYVPWSGSPVVRTTLDGGSREARLEDGFVRVGAVGSGTHVVEVKASK